jgi:hypothetical protein
MGLIGNDPMGLIGNDPTGLIGNAFRMLRYFPWDKVDDRVALKGHAAELGVQIGAINPNVFQDDAYRLGSVCHPDPAVRRQATDHALECVEICRGTGAGDQTSSTLWPFCWTRASWVDSILNSGIHNPQTPYIWSVRIELGPVRCGRRRRET